MASSSHGPAAGSESRYRQIIDSAKHFAIIGTDKDGRVTSWSKGAEQLLGWAEQEMLGQPLHRIFTPEDVTDGVPEREMHDARCNGYANDERWHLRKDGQRFWSVGEMTPLREADGELDGYVKLLRDRTREKAAQLRLQELTTQLESEVAARTRERDRLWHNSLDLLLVLDFGGILHAFNPAGTALLGYQPEELIGTHFQPLVHPDDLEATFDAVQRASQGPVPNFEVRIRHKNGGFRDFAWSAAPDGGFIYATGRDITVEKRQAEQLQQQAQARLRLALEAGQMGAWEWDIQHGEVRLLQGADLLHGFPPSDAPIRLASMEDYLKLVHPADRHALAEAIDRIRNRGSSQSDDHHAEYRIVWPNGRVQWLEARGVVFFDADGKPLQMSGVTINITRRKRTEQDMVFLANASAELASLVDPQSTLDKLARLAVPGFADWCAVDLLKEDGSLQRVSVAHVNPAKVARAHELHRRFPPDPQAANSTWQIVRSGEPSLRSEITDEMINAITSDPEKQAAIRDLGLRSYIGVPLAVHGKVLGVVTFIAAEGGRTYTEEDLSLASDLAQRAAVAVENARLYQALRQADHDKDVFLATLAHELRNPLAAISNGVSILRLAANDPLRVAQSAEVMDRQVGQLSRLVDDLLDIARITTGKVELRKERLGLVAIINNAIEASRPLIEAAQHKLTLDMAGEPAEVYADPTRLTQVFANLLNNAARYTEPRGRIDVRLECLADECVVSVRDNGIGIAPESLPHIFRMFAQVQHPLQRAQGGLGIGLSLVERLVAMHGGSVQASSAGIGQGSEFVVRLPREQAPPAVLPLPAAAREADQDWWSTQRILVVDDNQDAAATIADVLRMLGAEVHAVHDGLAAVEAALALQPGIVLLDIGLPGIDGHEAARRIRAAERERRIVLIALTGWGQQQDRQSAFDAGFDRHWVKPVSLEQLRSLADGTGPLASR